MGVHLVDVGLDCIKFKQELLVVDEVRHLFFKSLA